MPGIADVAKKAGVKEEQVKAVFKAVGELAKAERVTIKEFGGFEVKTRAARMAINPQNPTERIPVPEKKVLTFKPAKPKKA